MLNLGDVTQGSLPQSQQIFNLLPIPIAILQGDQFRIDFANDAMFGFWRRTRSAQIINRPLLDAFPETNPSFLRQLEQVFNTGTTYKDEEVLLSLNDEQGKPYSIYIDYTYQPIRDESMQVVAVLVTALDVSHKVTAKEILTQTAAQLEQSNRNLSAKNEECLMAIETAKLGTWMLYPEKAEMLLSERGAQLYGLKDTNIPFSTLIAITHLDYQERIISAFQESVRTGTRLDMEFPIYPIGSTADRWIRMTGRVLTTNKDGHVILNGTLMEITDQKMEVIRKNQFIGMASHELKTPLTSLTAMLQLVDRRLADEGNDQVQQLLAKSLKQIGRMTRMINSFVNISRLESGRFELNKDEFDMDELINEYLSEAKMTAPSHVFIQHNCESVVVVADRLKIGAVLANMISNAIKYSPRGSCIDISCKRSVEHLEVAVSDQGSGIAEKDRKRVFERFSHIENPHVMNSAGFGIGLYLCSEIIKHHHGEIWVENNEDLGCTFHFKLPL